MRAHGRGERRSPDMGVHRDAPTNESMGPPAFGEIISIEAAEELKGRRGMPAAETSLWLLYKNRLAGQIN